MIDLSINSSLVRKLLLVIPVCINKWIQSRILHRTRKPVQHKRIIPHHTRLIPKFIIVGSNVIIIY